MAENDALIESLKFRGLTCSKLKSMINKQLKDAKMDRKDSNVLKDLGFSKQAELQERIAQAQERSASALKEVKNKLCPLR